MEKMYLYLKKKKQFVSYAEWNSNKESYRIDVMQKLHQLEMLPAKKDPVYLLFQKQPDMFKSAGNCVCGSSISPATICTANHC